MLDFYSCTMNIRNKIQISTLRNYGLQLKRCNRTFLLSYTQQKDTLLTAETCSCVYTTKIHAVFDGYKGWFDCCSKITHYNI
jgi:hypothetical protein